MIPNSSSTKIFIRILNQNKIFKHYYSSKLNQMSEVICEKISSIGCITLNRPKQLNALNISMVKTILPQLKEWENDKTIKAIYIRGSPTTFCAGGDIKAIRDKAKSGDKGSALDFFKEEYHLNYAISNCKKTYMALINGITMGGGVGLSIHGKFRIATEKTVFAMPETAIGFFPDIGGSYALSRLKGSLGMYLALTGHRLKGKDVFNSGIATHYLDSSKIEKFEEALFKLNANDDITEILSQFCENINRNEILSDTDSFFNKESVEKILEALEKENTEWSKKQLNILNKLSPTSLKVTFKLINLSSTKSLKDVLSLDYQLCQRFVQESDFFEGVRALLIDKDNKPNWHPLKLKDLDEVKINWFFQPLNDDDKLKF